MDVLRSWTGKWVTVVAFVEPGVSLRPFGGFLSLEDGNGRALNATLQPAGTRIVFPVATFHDAEWVPGQENRGLSVEQGATRVDVFVED